MARSGQPTQWRSIAASCAIGLLVGAGTMNYTIVSQVAENRTLMIGLRRDVDRQFEDLRLEQKRTGEFMALLKEQNALMRQMLDSKNKP